MTWEQKLQACQALTSSIETKIHMREPGNWYVSQSGVDILGKHTTSTIGGGGNTPESAVESHFKALTVALKHGDCVQVRYGGKTRTVRWNGFMWADVDPASLP